MTSDVSIARSGARADLVLNRPDKRNALDLAMWRAIPALLAPLAKDPGVRVLVVRGAGGAFAAGADIEEFERAYATRAAALENQETMGAAMRALEDFPKPTLAQIDGACVGGGCGLALCCDLRFASEHARFGITPAKLGLSYGVEDTRRLVQAVGVSAAKDMLFTGRIFGAEEALGLRLVDRVFPASALEEETQRYITLLEAGSAYTAHGVKQSLTFIRDGVAAETSASRALFASAFEGEDFREGLAAFREKRAPRFR